MTDTEAEAALLALGAALEWMGYEREDYAEEEARTPTGKYLIKKNVRHHFFRDEIQCVVYFCTDETFFPVVGLPLYDNFGAAKAVCERHYATGKWE